MIRHILIGLGDAKNSVSATQTAIDLARIHNASLTGISVLDADRLGATGPVPIGAGQMAAELREFHLDEAGKVINEIEAQFELACQQADLPYQVERPQGEPYESFAEQARYHDIIVCGLGHLFEHGVVDEPPVELVKLVQAGVRPLIVVTKNYRAVNRVLIAYSGSMESAKAMKRFAQLRLWPDVTVRIVTFHHPKDEAVRLLKDANHYCGAHGYTLDTKYVAKSPKHGILQYANEWNADLIVMGNSHRNLLFRRIFGESMLHTVQHTDRPLFLAQ